MQRKQRLKRVCAALLAVAGLIVLIFWAYSLVTYGVWVDTHAAVGNSRPIDYAWGFSAAALFTAAVVVSLLPSRGRR